LLASIERLPERASDDAPISYRAYAGSLHADAPSEDEAIAALEYRVELIDSEYPPTLVPPRH
jgi:hypothetical protein